VVINTLINNITKIADGEQAELEKIIAKRQRHIEALRNLAQECEQINDPQLTTLLCSLKDANETRVETWHKYTQANDADAPALKQAYDDYHDTAEVCEKRLTDYLEQHGYTYIGIGLLADTALEVYSFPLDGLHFESEWDHYEINQLHMKGRSASE
jgi:chromosome segregation ATPase